MQAGSELSGGLGTALRLIEQGRELMRQSGLRWDEAYRQVLLARRRMPLDPPKRAENAAER